MMFPALSKELIGGAGIAIGLVSYIPYFISIRRGRTTPHAFSWILWTLLTWIAFAIQVAAGAGPGAWATGCSAILTTAIAGISISHGERHVTRSDWFTFVAGLAAIPLWIVTRDPTASAILVTLIDCLGFYPTMRKSWWRPHQELLYTHSLSLGKHALSIAALTVISIPTAFYPAGLFLMNVVLVGIIIGRRRSAPGDGDHKEPVVPPIG